VSDRAGEGRDLLSTTPGQSGEIGAGPDPAEVSDATSSPARPAATGRAATRRERAEGTREAKLESVREQVENGSLVIRQMGDDERRRYPPRAEQPKRPRRW